MSATRSSPFLLGVKPPEKGAPRSVQLRFVRDLEMRSSALALLLFLALFIGQGGTVPLIACLIVLLGSGAHLAWLTVRSRRLAAAGD
jgi:hypothetical protein